MCAPDQKPHIAIICDTIPYPARSGDNQRISELIRVLRREGWFVHFVLAGFLDRRTREICRDKVDALHAYVGWRCSTLIRNWLRRCVRLLDRVMKKLELPPAEELASRMLGRSVTPIVLDYWKRYPQGLDEFVAELATQYPWNAVIVEYIWLYPAAQKLRNGVLRLLDTQDIQHKRVKEFASRGMTFPLRITRDEEASIFNHFDAIIAIQAAEAADIKAMCPQLEVLTVGSMGSHPRNPTEGVVVHGRVLYVGGFNGANIDGLRRFLTTVWPHIHQQETDSHLHVCGYVYRGFLGEKFDQVKFLGHVENIEPEYAQAAVVINPSWIGTGLKIKSVEALARGKPLVSTRKGVEGLNENVEKSAFICDDDVEFADSVIRLMRDDGLRKSVSEAAQQFARDHLDAATVYGELLTYLDERT
jgi:glycosyltransferase involved in cell wall biosynthesis